MITTSLRYLWVVGLLAATSLACALTSGGGAPRVPTPIPSAPAIQQAGVDIPENTVFDPVGSIRIGQDPTIMALVNAVSTQNLQNYVATLESFGTRNTFSTTQDPAFGIGAARTWIYNEFLAVGNGRLQVRFDDFLVPHDGRTHPAQNVIATLPGTSSHTGVIIVMAHYDTRPQDAYDGLSRAPGADDNGSGVATLIELARLMSSRTWNQTILFVAFAAEEQGNFGSLHFVQNGLLNNIQVDAAINNDSVGGRTGIPQSVRVYAPGPDSSSHQHLARYIDLIGKQYLADFPITLIEALDREGRWGDHRSFITAGLPAVRIIESQEDTSIQNSTRDTWGLIDYNYHAQITRLNLATVANLAGAPKPPEPPTITPMATAGTYLFTWPPDRQASGYAIIFRRPGEATYDNAIFHYIDQAEAGNVALSGFDPQQAYAVSLAALDINGRISRLSPELIIGPQP